MKYRITAEHCSGQSVSHPCIRGVYDDPANEMDIVVEAADDADAERVGVEYLRRRCEDTPPCGCKRKWQPGGESWWQSVAVSVTEILN